MFLLALFPTAQGVAGDNQAQLPDHEVGDRLGGEYREFRAYSLYDLRRPSEGERDLRIGETLYRVDAGDLTILHIIPLTGIVLN